MQPQRLLTGSALLAFIASGVLALPSAAQAGDDAEADNDRRLGTITVTATKREASLQDVPVAVTALSGELLENAGVGSVDSLSTIAPSVTFTQSTNDQNNSVRIRGIGTSVFSVGVEPSVSIVVDDVVMARQGQGFQDLVDIERVEVLRGPQSTLFGKNASAGVISVTTAAPTDTFTGRIQGTIAEGEEYSLGGTLSGPLSDTVSGRLTGYVKERGGHIENVFDDRDFNGYENWGARGKLLFEPNEALDITLIAEYRNTEQDCCIYVRSSSDRFAGQAGFDALLAPAVASEENTQVNVNAPTFNNSDQYGASIKAEYEFDSGLTFTSISATRGWDFENNLDADGFSNENPVPGSGFLTFDLNSGTTEVTQFSQEFRLTSPQGETFDYVVGAYGFFLDLDRTFQRRLESVFPTPGGLIPIGLSGSFESNVANTNLAVFGSGNWYVTDNTTIFGGLRLINEELEYDVDRSPADTVVAGDFPLPGIFGSPVNVDESVDDSVVTGEIGVRRNFAENVQGYARYARGYKGRAVDASFGAPSNVEPIEAEVSDAFELGLKSTLANGNLILNIAAFHTEYEDFQEQATVLLPDNTGIINAEARLTNVGSVTTSGIEIETIATPTDTITLQAGLSFTDASIDEFANASCYFGQTAAQGCVPITVNDGGTPGDPSDDTTVNLQDLSGGDLPNAPDWRFTGSVRKDIPLAMSFDGFVQVSGRWQSDVNFSLNGDPVSVQDSFGIVNLALGITDDDGRYTASVFVNNLFDEFYATNRFTDFLYNGVINTYVPRDFERYVGAKLSVDF